MPIINFPEIFLPENIALPELYIVDYKMTDDIVKNKANVNLNLFSFLQVGQKKVHFPEATVEVNENQSILIKSGNCLFTELLNNSQIYYCKLFFFSTNAIESFLNKHTFEKRIITTQSPSDSPCFIIENDGYIKSFIASLSLISELENPLLSKLLATKFEELMLYLITKYGINFVQYLYSLVKNDRQSTFRNTITINTYANLKLEEMAFLCNMSLSTFKRHFEKEYQEKPGRWFQRKRLYRAKLLIESGEEDISTIFMKSGYHNFSNFSTAFKNEFGGSPSKFRKNEPFS